MIDFLNTKFSQSEALGKLPEQKEHTPIPAKRFERIRGWFSERSKRKLFILSTSAFFLAAVLIYLTVITPMKVIYTKAVGMEGSVSRLRTDFERRDLPAMVESLKEVEVELSELRNAYQRLSYLGVIPLASDYYRDGKHLLEAASLSVEGGGMLLESISPLGNVLGLTEGFGRHLTTEQHVARLAEVLPQISPQIDVALGRLFLVKAEIDQIDSSRYGNNRG